MQIKKLFKYLPISLMTAGLILTTSLTPPILLKNNDHETNLVEQNINQGSNDTDQIDPIEYIRNDVIKQTGDPTVIESIKLSESSSLSNHSGAIVNKKDGSTLLYMWGSNSNGQLGLGDSGTGTNRPRPQLVAIPGNVSQVALGQIHSAAIADGKLYTWGRNDVGQLGLGNVSPQPTPKPVTALSNVSQVSLGETHSAAIADGKLYTWGYNYDGKLGYGMTAAITQPTPRQVATLDNVSQVSLGQYHSAAIADGKLYTWGSHSNGILGLGAETTTDQPSPKLVALNSVSQVSLGQYHSAAIADGKLYTWGYNGYGQLGLGVGVETIFSEASPEVVALNNVSRVSLGQYHSAAIADGKLYTWGFSGNGILGLGAETTDNQPSPKLVTMPSKVSQVSLGKQHNAAVLENGSLYTWGYNGYGQLGLGDSGTGTDKWTPTHMPYLGKDSHIIAANDQLTPEEVVNKIWVNGAFSLTGFKESFTLTNLPDVAGKPITMASEPKFSNDDGTVTMTISIPNYYDENGYWVEDTTASPMIIGGFKKGPNSLTSITAKATYNQDIVVDKWLESMKGDNGNYDQTKLSQYLELTKVPTDAKFTITVTDPGHKTGILKFNIVSDKITLEGDIVENTESDPFPITLNLTPRITVMTPITADYPADLTAAELKTELFGTGTSVLNKVILEQYMTVKAPVDNVNYHLVDNSWNSIPSDGIVTFKIYADKYYDSEGDLQTGSATTPASVVNFNLKLQPELSSIEVLTPPANVRVDAFETYINADGNSINSPRFKEFFKLTNAPSTATFTISDVVPKPYDENFVRNQVDFKLTIDKFNQEGTTNPAVYEKNYTLTLGEQHMPTNVVAQTGDLTHLRVDKVEDNLNTLTGDALITYLKQFLVIESIPTTATVTVSGVSGNIDTGELEFTLTLDQIYDADSNLITKDEVKTFKLTFDIKHDPTVIDQNINHPEVRIDTFANNVNTLKGQALYDYLVPDYVTTQSIIDETKLTARVVEQDNDTGAIKVKVSVPSYYYGDSILSNESMDKTFDYQLTPVYQDTVIDVLSRYPTDIMPSEFAQQIFVDGKTDIDFLSRFISFGLVPPNTTYTVDITHQDDETGILIFDLTLDQYYANGDLQPSKLPKTNIELQLKTTTAPAQPQTIVTVKPDAPAIADAQSFLASVTLADNIVDFAKLEKYVDGLTTIPSSATVTIKLKQESAAKATFTLTVSKHYTQAGSLGDTKIFNFDLAITPKFTPTDIKTLERGIYPVDITPTDFKQEIMNNITSTTNDKHILSSTNIKFLSSFLDFTSVPTNTTYTLTWNDEQFNMATRQIGFNITLDQYYNANGQLVSNPIKTYNDLVLWFAIGIPPTDLFTREDSPLVASEQEFMNRIYPNGNLDKIELDLFVGGIQTIPLYAEIKVLTPRVDSNGRVTSTIYVSQHYNEYGELKGEATYDFTIKVEQNSANVNTNSFPWWWIVVAVGGVIIIGGSIWLIVKKKKNYRP